MAVAGHRETCFRRQSSWPPDTPCCKTAALAMKSLPPCRPLRPMKTSNAGGECRCPLERPFEQPFCNCISWHCFWRRGCLRAGPPVRDAARIQLPHRRPMADGDCGVMDGDGMPRGVRQLFWQRDRQLTSRLMGVGGVRLSSERGVNLAAVFTTTCR